MNDLRYALRMLLKSPGFSLVAIHTLALGANSSTHPSWLCRRAGILPAQFGKRASWKLAL
jgi:hypothetical protein